MTDLIEQSPVSKASMGPSTYPFTLYVLSKNHNANSHRLGPPVSPWHYKKEVSKWQRLCEKVD